MVTRLKRLSVVIIMAAFSLPVAAFACACGCNVFAVGARWVMPTSTGLGLFLQYNYMDQTRNWGNWNVASGDANQDKEIRTGLYTVGFQYMASRDWGLMGEAPLWNRYFRTTADDGSIASVNHASFGDLRLMGIYTGLSEDMSTGLQFGVKLPTGAFNQSLLDRDTQIGTGTTDFLLGGYQMGQENGWGWYAQLMWQHAFNSRVGYRPGDSFDVNGGIHYDNLLNEYRIVPMLLLVASFRAIDSGPYADPPNTGYERLYISPSIEVVATNHLSIYGDLKIPLVTHVRGYQLVAPALIGVTVGYNV